MTNGREERSGTGKGFPGYSSRFAEESLIQDGRQHCLMPLIGQPYRRLSTLWQRAPDEGHAFACRKLPHFAACLLEKRESCAAELLAPGLIVYYRDRLRSGDRRRGGSSLALAGADGACRPLSLRFAYGHTACPELCERTIDTAGAAISWPDPREPRNSA
jgi:hypothetical protein